VLTQCSLGDGCRVAKQSVKGIVQCNTCVIYDPADTNIMEYVEYISARIRRYSVPGHWPPFPANRIILHKKLSTFVHTQIAATRCISSDACIMIIVHTFNELYMKYYVLILKVLMLQIILDLMFCNL
jgi:hypothetical protein